MSGGVISGRQWQMIVIGNVLPLWSQYTDDQIKTLIATSFSSVIPMNETGYVTGVQIGRIGEQFTFPLPSGGNIEKS